MFSSREVTWRQRASAGSRGAVQQQRAGGEDDELLECVLHSAQAPQIAGQRLGGCGGVNRLRPSRHVQQPQPHKALPGAH